MAGAAADARHLTKKGEDVAQWKCSCGFAGPSRTHLTFHCPLREWTLPARSTLEQRLLLALGPAPPRWPLADYDAQFRRVAGHLALLAEDEVHYVATDGGCLLARGADFQQRAAWAVSFGGATFSGLVQGPEQTAAEGERVAVYVLAAALLLHGRRLRLLVDNQAVAGRLRGGRPACESGDPWWLWRTIAQATPCLETFWIPSHEKQPLWKAPDGWCSEAACRRLNSLADAAVSHELAPYRAAVAACEKDASVRRAWSAAAVASQTAATQEYHDKFVELVRSLPPRPSGRGRRASA